MKILFYFFALFAFTATGQVDKMNYFVGFDTGLINQFKLNEVLRNNNLNEVNENTFGLTIGYTYIPGKLGYYSDLSYQRSLNASIYQSFGFSAGIVFQQKFLKNSSINYISFLKLRSHNINVINSDGNNVLPDQLATISGGDLFFYNRTIGFGGKISFNFNSTWIFGISYDSAVTEINWNLKNQHISSIPSDSFSSIGLSLGFIFKSM